MLPAFIEDLSLLFFPEYCRGCSCTLAKSEQLICITCLNKLPKSNFLNRKENPVEKVFWGRVKINLGFSFLLFSKKGLVQSLLHELKYNNCPELGKYLGALMGREIQLSKHQFDAVVPVPLHPKKQHQRGYNQSLEIAQGLSETLDIPVHEVLKRKTHGASQTRKTKFERWNNVSSVFELLPAGHLQGRHVLLIDDVITTGATTEACVMHLNTIPHVVISVASLAFPFN